MLLGEIISKLYDYLVQFIPVYRVICLASVVVGIILVAAALVLNKNSEQRRKLPFVLGIVGVLIFVSSGAQLLGSLL